MKKRVLSLFTALCLCLTLLPAAAQAAGNKVEYNGVILEAGNMYEVKHDTEHDTYSLEVMPSLPSDNYCYLEYDGSTLTVHNDVPLTFGSDPLEISGSVTITGEESSGPLPTQLLLNGITLSPGAALTLDGGVDIQIIQNCIQGSAGASYPTLTTTDNYSGVIYFEAATDSPAVKDVSLNIKNSHSITLEGSIQYTGGGTTPGATLKSSGGILLEKQDAANGPSSLTLEGGGNSSVTITGNSSGRDVFFPGSVTFKNCGSVSITDANSGGQLVSGGTIKSNCICEVTQGSAKSVLVPGDDGVTAQWNLGTLSTPDISITVTAPTAYKAGDGWILCKPETPVKVTLDNASYDGLFRIQNSADVELELKGENALGTITCNQNLTLTGTGSLAGDISIAPGGVFTKTSGTLNGIVYTSAISVYGNVTLSNRLLEGTSEMPIKITPGATLTIPNGKGLTIIDADGLENKGTLVNNGTIQLTLSADASGDEISALIEGFSLSGDGKVSVKVNDGTNPPVSKGTYTNEGEKLLPPAGVGGVLDLHDTGTTDDTHLEDQGYKWEPVLDTDSGDIVSGTLTLKKGFNADIVAVPGVPVTIVAEGDSVIGYLATNTTDPVNASLQDDLTISGPGKLTIQNHVEVSGAGSRVTVNAGAQVEVTDGLTVCDSGLFDGAVIVNGILKVTNDGDSAVKTGKVEVGSGGKLEVYGDTGLELGGMRSAADPSVKDFHGLFILAPGGQFTGNCTDRIINVHETNETPFEGSLSASDVISIPSGYLPSGLTPGFDEDHKFLTIPGGGGAFHIDSTNVPTPPVVGHTHRWAADWTTSETHHWHECTASGCTVTDDSRKDGYGEHVFDDDRDAVCDLCGYTRSLPTPEPPSGGDWDDGDDWDGWDDRTDGESYKVTVEQPEHGTIRTSRGSASAGSTVTLTAIPDSGYMLDSLTVTDSRGVSLALTEKNGRYTFTMPEGAVTVHAVFVPETCDGGAGCPSRSFTDLGGPGTWYHEAVDYVLRAGVMGGYGNGLFKPDASLTRAQFVQILYNMEGRPPVAADGAFPDVASGAWCESAVAWAAQRGITGGFEDGRFQPDSSITREQLAVMLWRYAGSPSAGRALDFSDTDRAGAYALEALSWAVETGVMSGRTGGALDPKGIATRAQAAQMLRNFMNQ